jgi:hypothetical protein
VPFGRLISRSHRSRFPVQRTPQGHKDAHDELGTHPTPNP